MVEYTAEQLASKVAARVVGDGSVKVSGLGALNGATAGQLSHLSHASYRRYLATTRASVVLVRERDVSECPVTALVVADPYVAYAQLSRLFSCEPTLARGVHPSAIVAATARVHASAAIGPYTVIGADVHVGANCRIDAHCSVGDRSTLGESVHLWPFVSVYHDVVIGARSIVHSHSALGADGFGYARDARGRQEKIAQLGGLVIGEDVEIGACSSIDRGAIEPTRIGRGVKIDNQVQIGHNCDIGENSLICGCVGVVGSTKIGRNCVIAGGVGIGGGAPITLADGVVVSGMTHVTQSIPSAGVYSGGVLAEPTRAWKRNALRFKDLDGLSRRLQALERTRDKGA